MAVAATDRAGSAGPLRVAHIIRAPVGGAYRHVRDLTRGLSDQGHEFALITDPSHAGAACVDEEQQFKLGCFYLKIGKLPGIHDAVALWQVIRTLRAVRPDVIHCHGAKGGLYGRLARLLAPGCGAVVVYTPHGGVLHLNPRRSPHLFLAERALVRWTDAVIFVSRYEARMFRARVASSGSVRQRIIHNGLRADEFVSRGDGPREIDVAFLGELRDLKGVDTLIDALAVLRDRGVKVRAVVAGPGSLESVARYQAQARSAGLTIDFPGKVEPVGLLSRARLLVFPSRSEALPYALMEAIARGVPVVATNVGGIPEVIGNDGALASPGDAQELASMIQDALGDPIGTARLAEVRQQHAREAFNLNEALAETLALYRQLTGSNVKGLDAGMDGQWTAVRRLRWALRSQKTAIK